MKAVILLLVSIPMLITCEGAFGASPAANGSSAPNDASSFHLPVCKTYQGRCLAILRPQGDAGIITLKAETDNLTTLLITIGAR